MWRSCEVSVSPPIKHLDYVLIMKHSRLLASIAFFIIYGSLYPFNFSPAKPDALAQLFSNRTLLTTKGDMLSNVALFAPFGVIAMLGCATRWGLFKAALGAVMTGLTIALALQVLQIFLPTRHATLADFFWNMLGIFGGVVTGGIIAKFEPGLTARHPQKTMPLLLLAALVAIEWFPFSPGLDLQLVKKNLISLWSTPVTLAAPLWQGITVALLAGYLLESVIRRPQATRWLVLFILMISFGKLFMNDNLIQPSSPAGLTLGALGWWLIKQNPEAGRRDLVWLTMVLCYTASALQPYQLQDKATPISWLPFATMLEGSVLHNIGSLASSLVLYVGILYIGAMASGKLASATLGLALWVLIVELAQSLVKTRSADITEPLLVLFVGLALAKFQPVQHDRPKESASTTLLDHPRQSCELAEWLLKTGTATGVLMLGMTVVLSLPSLPYNVRELLRSEASLPALFAFSVALLWAGAGPVWLGTHLAKAHRPGLQLLPLTLLVCAISLTWLWAGVSTESVEDISGSANRFWFVTQQEVWGAAWKNVFLLIGSRQLIDVVEHFVRYSALYAPLPIVLGVLLVLRQSPWRGKERFRSLTGLLLSAGTLLWLCKAIAFDWSSTDNLNELIAKDGEWGWGGGGFLYALLLLVCINALLLAEAANGGWHGLGLAVLLSLVALPMGWWLLNQGLEQSVKKYGLVYSGPQFLLGESRLLPLSQELLFLRWCAVQASTALILATGVWLGQEASTKNLKPAHPWLHTSSTQENWTS
jgi:VanZ family protein